LDHAERITRGQPSWHDSYIAQGDGSRTDRLGQVARDRYPVMYGKTKAFLQPLIARRKHEYCSHTRRCGPPPRNSLRPMKS
jgi:hypothetical protein